MIQKILIANRGEIAVRIMETCRDMGISTVGVYSDADARAKHTGFADEAIHIGASPAVESYLNIPKIIAAAQRTGADAIHPGYGFLAENAGFAQAVIDAGMTWIGPPPNVIALMGDKRQAKLTLQDVPLVPGYNGDDQSDDALIAAADAIGFPLMVKAAAGGGGKGMRAVHTPDDLPDALAVARREASQAFADSTLILERLIQNPRHIEIQIFGDTHGNIVAMGERECSIQRRHQKIIEECPSPTVDDDLRAKLTDVAIRIGGQIGYIGAGTIEFLLDAERNFYFMEMNTRLQVEHRVTEIVYGVDLVALQIRVAEGGNLTALYQPPAKINKHAIEARIYAEDPANGFLPTTGKVLVWFVYRTLNPDRVAGIRLDSALRRDDEVTVFYDPMLAKIISHSDSGGRAEAIRKLSRELADTPLLGLRVNIDFLRRVIIHPEFITGNIDTGFIDRHPELLPNPPIPVAAIIACAIQKSGLHEYDDDEDNDQRTHWRNNAYRPIRHTFTSGQERFEVLMSLRKDDVVETRIGDAVYQVSFPHDYNLELSIDGHLQNFTVTEGADNVWWVHSSAGTFSLTWIDPLPVGAPAAENAGSLRAPMAGTITSIQVVSGDRVKKGDTLLVMEAMKMEHRIQAPYDGSVQALYFSVGQSVQAGATLLALTSDEDKS